jgi:hypothetical protein
VRNPDARLLEGDPIEVKESTLTGKSLPAANTWRGDALGFDHPLWQNQRTPVNNVPENLHR